MATIQDFLYKVAIPDRSAGLISRPRLDPLLGIIANRRLLTVSAPAGYGKTAMLIDFATQRLALPVCWYTLDSADREVWVFLHYLIASVSHRFPGALAQTHSALNDNTPSSLSSVVATVVHDIYAIAEDFVLIIDDWHLVDQVEEITDIVEQLLMRCPRCHMILASRSYPNLPNIMLLTARRQMSSLNEQHIRFTAEEAVAVLAAEGGCGLAATAATLVEQTSGWITGVLLLAAAPTALELTTTTYTERLVYRFLAEQVFDQQPQDVQTFLLESSLLDELTPKRCNALFQRGDSSRLLDTLLRRHLFVSEVVPGVLRYQPMFREFLQEQFRVLKPERYGVVAAHIAEDYLAHSQWSLAFALYTSVGNQASAQRVMETAGEQLYSSGRLETLEHWFSNLPSHALSVPLLCLKARVLIDRGADEEAQTLANLAAMRMTPSEEPLVLLLQAQIGRILGRYEQSLALVQRVQNASLPPAQQAMALRTLAICRHRLGQTHEAIVEFQAALLIEEQRGDPQGVAQIQRDLGICFAATGRLREAETYYTQADVYWSTTNNAGMRTMSLNSKGGVQHMMGRFQDAYQTLSSALTYAKEAAVPNYQAAVLSNLGDLFCDLQLWARAQEAYDAARHLGGSAHLKTCLDLSQVRLMLYQRQYEEAARLLRLLPDAAFQAQPCTVRLLRGNIACGTGKYADAQSCAQQVIDALRNDGAASMDLARAYLLQARVVAQASPAEHGRVIALLNQALEVSGALGHDAFLVTDVLHMPSVLRCLGLAAWPPMAAWCQRHQDMQFVAQSLDEHDQRSVLTVRVLRPDQILLDGQPVELGWHKAREVFYYLLARPDGGPIDVLREAIWPNLPLESSRNALRSAIYQLRSVLPRESITLLGRQVYKLNRDVVRLDYDAERFEKLAGIADDDQEVLYEALDLYRAPYLAGVENAWCEALRTHFERQVVNVLHRIATRAERNQLFPEALSVYQRALQLDLLDEVAHAGAMRCWLALGNRGAAINQYQQLRTLLDEELGLELGSDSEAEQLFMHILQSA